MAKNSGILCYATPEDRLRLAAIAKAQGTSGSNWILQAIRARFTELFGDLDPKLASPEQV